MLSDRVCERTDNPARFRLEALWFCLCQRVRNGEKVTICRHCQTVSNRNPTAHVFDTDWSPSLVYIWGLAFGVYPTSSACLESDWFSLEISVDSLRFDVSGRHKSAV